jgi:hypothetical protein
MSKLIIAPSKLDAEPPPLVDPRSVAALETAGSFFEMLAEWKHLLER